MPNSKRFYNVNSHHLMFNKENNRIKQQLSEGKETPIVIVIFIM